MKTTPIRNVMFAICLLTTAAMGQPVAPPSLPLGTYSTKIVRALEQVKTVLYKDSGNTLMCSDLANNIVDLECTNIPGFLDYFAASTLHKDLLSAAEELLSNHAPGSTSASAGSSSLVSKATVPEVLGFAVDAGALTQSSSGSTTTFTANARGVYRYLTGNQVYKYCPNSLVCDGKLSGIAHRLSGSLSLDNTNSSTGTAPTSGTTASPNMATSPAAISGSAFRMSSWGTKFQVPLGHFDTSGPQFRKLWDAQLDKQKNPDLEKAAQVLNEKLAAAFDDFEISSNYAEWRKEAKADIVKLLSQTPPPSQRTVEGVLANHLAKLVELVQKQGLDGKLVDAQTALSGFFAARDTVVSGVQSKLPGLSLAYTNLHPLNQANVSNFKLIFEFQPKAGKTSISANVAADIYDHLPAGTTVGRWRDLQISAEGDYTFSTRYGNPVFSLAGYYQYQATNAVLQITAGSTAPGTDIMLNGSAPALLAPKGNIWIGQAMMTFPVKNGTTKIPVGISYASRTELLTGSVVRAHIGVNFDFDQLFMK